MKLLIADDDPIILDLLVEIFVAYGFDDIVLTSDGAEALRAVEESPQPFDYLLLDIQMPVLDGITLCRKLRALPGYAKTPIIMITAMTDKVHIDAAFLAGATDYTPKPFDVRMLISQVRRAEQPAAVLPCPTSALAPEERDFSDTTALKKQISGFVGEQALLNYAKVLQDQGEYSIAAVPITVHALHDLFERLPAAGFEAALGDVSQMIFESLVGTQAVLSYVGDGQFLCLCDAQRLMSEGALHAELEHALNHTNRPWKQMVPDGVKLCVHPYETPKQRTQRGDTFFADRALRAMKQHHCDRPSRLSKLFVMRLKNAQLSNMLQTKRRAVWQKVYPPASAVPDSPSEMTRNLGPQSVRDTGNENADSRS